MKLMNKLLIVGVGFSIVGIIGGDVQPVEQKSIIQRLQEKLGLEKFLSKKGVPTAPAKPAPTAEILAMAAALEASAKNVQEQASKLQETIRQEPAAAAPARRGGPPAPLIDIAAEAKAKEAERAEIEKKKLELRRLAARAKTEAIPEQTAPKVEKKPILGGLEEAIKRRAEALASKKDVVVQPGQKITGAAGETALTTGGFGLRPTPRPQLGQSTGTQVTPDWMIQRQRQLAAAAAKPVR